MFRVTITAIDETTETTQEYEKLYDDAGFERVQAKDPEARQYGYVDKTETKRKERAIYDQTVEDIDISDVVKAVNKLS